MTTATPQEKFDDSRAVPYFPRPVVKWATLVPIRDNYVTWITPEWDADGSSPQNFEGSYYLIVDSKGKGRYGSARIQWENMHTQLPMDRVVGDVPAMAWVKVAVPTGYHVDHDCQIVTGLNPDFSEVRKSIAAGTLIIRQPGGEIQHVRPQDEAATYYSEDEARLPRQVTIDGEVRTLSLRDMTMAQFRTFAVEEALKTLVSAPAVA